jgi:solute carrier family 25 (adenine nucleotide translocator) protein 4/5/6/31
VDCFRRVHAEQGLRAFWRGNLVNCLRYAPQQGSALAFNDFYHNLFPRYDPATQFPRYFGANLLAGGMGGGTAMVICYPLDYARTRLASDLTAGKQGQFSGVVDCLVKTVRQQGLTGLYRGTAVSIAGAFVYRGGELGLFGTVMGLNPYKDDKGAKGLGAAVLIGAAARTAVLPFNYPFDTVRRRMMVESDLPASRRQYKSGTDCARQVLRREGVRGLYRGVLSEVLSGFGGVMVIVVYDRLKLHLGM